MSEEKLLTTDELAERWSMKSQTLRVWRTKHKGPKFIRIGGTVRYKIEDVEKYENREL